MESNRHIENTLLYYWVKNLVGSGPSYTFNLILTIVFGCLYSFSIVPSPYILLVFGVVSPIIFTICLYFSIRHISELLPGMAFPRALLSANTNILMMLFDVCVIISFASLIYTNILNYFLFRFLQTIFFPTLLLIFLRILYISHLIGKQGGGKPNNESII